MKSLWTVSMPPGARSEVRAWQKAFRGAVTGLRMAIGRFRWAMRRFEQAFVSSVCGEIALLFVVVELFGRGARGVALSYHRERPSAGGRWKPPGFTQEQEAGMPSFIALYPLILKIVLGQDAWHHWWRGKLD